MFVCIVSAPRGGIVICRCEYGVMVRKVKMGVSGSQRVIDVGAEPGLNHFKFIVIPDYTLESCACEACLPVRASPA